MNILIIRAFIRPRAASDSKAVKNPQGKNKQGQAWRHGEGKRT
jgi:hypothetical protein